MIFVKLKSTLTLWEETVQLPTVPRVGERLKLVEDSHLRTVTEVVWEPNASPRVTVFYR